MEAVDLAKFAGPLVAYVLLWRERERDEPVPGFANQEFDVRLGNRVIIHIPICQHSAYFL